MTWLFAVLSTIASTLLFLISAASTAYSTELTFAGFYAGDFNWWNLALGAALAIVAGATIYITSGAATPLVKGIGTWIGGLWGFHGAAATSFGLALLGGGSLASGGFGMAGGIAVLTTAIAFTERTAPFTAGYVYNEYDKQRFIDRSIEMVVLPLPLKPIGSPEHRQAVEIIRKHFTATAQNENADAENVDVQRNRRVIAAALQLSDAGNAGSLSQSQGAQVHSGRALMQLYNGDHSGALASIYAALSADAASTVKLFEKDSKSVPLSLPAAVWAIASLSEETVRIEDTLVALDYSLAKEPDKKYAPIVVSAFTDRLLLRDDILRPAHMRRIYESVRDSVREERARAAAMLVIAYKCFILLKLNQDYVTTREVGGTNSDPERVRRALETYDAMLLLLRELLTDVRSNVTYFEKSLDNRNHTGVLSGQLHEYTAFRPRLRELVDKLL